ncbi:restriction endonuclease [Candidatus Poribacteria bacterium]|nr:restriction endonuclease [Candidatus Poribacteria bacterium]
MGTIKMTNRTAFNPITKEPYEIDMPTTELVRESILKLDFPIEGLRIVEVTDLLVDKFQLTEKQKNAVYKAGNRFLELFRYRLVDQIMRDLCKKGKLIQPGGKNTPYFLAKNPSNTQKHFMQHKHSIEDIYQKERVELASQLLEEIKNNEPSFFEKLVIDLLVKMGYGGSREDAGKAVGRSGDGGIDGIIKEDRLGLDVVYIQAKRQEQNVGEPPIRDFVGALDGEGAQKGIFITTSSFSDKASRFAERSSKTLVLIDGQQLAQYMIEHNVGVFITKTYEIKRVDSDYFSNEE